jgi:hypothetical protein
MAYATELAETERIEDARLVIERRREALQLTKAASPATAVVAALCYGEGAGQKDWIWFCTGNKGPRSFVMDELTPWRSLPTHVRPETA